MFAHRLKLFELMGFKVHVDVSWLLLAILIAWSLAAGYFPFVAPGLSDAVYWSMGVVGLIGLAASIIVHEFAHSLVARRYQMPIHGITLFIFGGVAEMAEEPTSAKGEFFMAIVGPLTSLVLAGMFWLATGLFPEAQAQHPVALVLGYLAFINAALAVFNMIPAFPLDGGRVLRSAIWYFKGDIMRATRIASNIGAGFAFLLMALGLLSVIGGNFIGGIWWFLIGLFVRAAAAGGYERQVQRRALSGAAVARFMRRDPVAVRADMRLDRVVEDYFYRYYFKSFPVVDAENRLVGCVSLQAVREVDHGTWPQRNVRSVMQECGEDVVAPDTDSAEALAQMQRGGRTRLFVTDRAGQLIGVLSLRDLMNYLSVRMEMEE